MQLRDEVEDGVEGDAFVLHVSCDVVGIVPPMWALEREYFVHDA